MQQIIDTLLRPFSPLFPSDRGGLSLLDWERGRIQQVWLFGEDPPVFTGVPGGALPTGHPWGQAAESGQALFSSHGQNLPPLPGADRTEPPPAPFAVALVPLPGRERAHAMLILEISGDHTFDADEQAFLLSLAALVGQALDRALLTTRQQALQEALGERNQELRGYTYALSRNLGEPVQRIWNFLKLVEGKLGEQFDVRERRLFTLARQEAEQLAGRIDELRSLALIEQRALRPETLNLNVLVVQIRHDLEPLTREHQVRWEVQLLPNIQGDALLTWQALIEVFVFAIEDAWERELPVVRVEAETVEGQVVLRLESNGQGFPEDLEERIFDVLDHSVPRKTPFGRLGLSNVRRALGRQGGWARAEGRPGRGVRFVLTLPRAEEVSSVEGHP